MDTYIILSRFSPRAFGEPGKIKALAAAVSKRIKKGCPEVTWKDGFATTGGFDVVEIVEAKDAREVERAAMVIHSHGHSSTGIRSGTPWKDFIVLF